MSQRGLSDERVPDISRQPPSRRGLLELLESNGNNRARREHWRTVGIRGLSRMLCIVPSAEPKKEHKKLDEASGEQGTIESEPIGGSKRPEQIKQYNKARGKKRRVARSIKAILRTMLVRVEFPAYDHRYLGRISEEEKGYRGQKGPEDGPGSGGREGGCRRGPKTAGSEDEEQRGGGRKGDGRKLVSRKETTENAGLAETRNKTKKQGGEGQEPRKRTTRGKQASEKCTGFNETVNTSDEAPETEQFRGSPRER